MIFFTGPANSLLVETITSAKIFRIKSSRQKTIITNNLSKQDVLMFYHTVLVFKNLQTISCQKKGYSQ
ncbi:hypothetical protein BXU11_12575 [Flavobacterium sp. LM5]|nr:hypothetical protein BXU11_12575 [Flavobacterium sp. LM5]